MICNNIFPTNLLKITIIITVIAILTRLCTSLEENSDVILKEVKEELGVHERILKFSCGKLSVLDLNNCNLIASHSEKLTKLEFFSRIRVCRKTFRLQLQTFDQDLAYQTCHTLAQRYEAKFVSFNYRKGHNLNSFRSHMRSR